MTVPRFISSSRSASVYCKFKAGRQNWRRQDWRTKQAKGRGRSSLLDRRQCRLSLRGFHRDHLNPQGGLGGQHSNPHFTETRHTDGLTCHTASQRQIQALKLEFLITVPCPRGCSPWETLSSVFPAHQTLLSSSSSSTWPRWYQNLLG